MGKHNKHGRKEKHKEKQYHVHEDVERVENAYNFIERRQIIGGVKNVEDLPQLGSLYSAQMLKYSKKSDPEFEIDDYDADEDKPNRLLKLPDDGSIFNDGIPFHHFALTNLKEKHIKRLKKNGIELRKGHFSISEDKLLRENWASYAAKHNLTDEDVIEFMGAAAATESNDEHRKRIRFIHQTLFRPWMCSKILDRSAIQIFRRCYHLFMVSSKIEDDLREWSKEDDKRLLELVEKYGRKWEYIGNELLHPRYSCLRRYEKLVAEDEDQEWNRIEIARLYDYLCDHLPRNPAIIALIPKYENLDSHINWEDVRMKLPRRSADERKNKWQELKQDLRATREHIQSDVVKEILRAVFPDDPHLLAKAAFKRRKKMKCPQMADYLDILTEFCTLNKVNNAREIRPEHIEEMLNAKGLSDSDFPASHFLRIAKYLLFLGNRIQLFKILPVNQDTLLVHFEMFSFILRNVKKFRVKKKETRKLAREFVRQKGWEQRNKFVFVEKRTKEDEEEYEETPNKLIHFLKRRKSFHKIKNE